MTPRTKIATPDAPQAIGPYSQAITAGGVVYCSGQIAFDPKTMQLDTGDVAAQTERALQNLAAVLKAAGSDLSKVVRTTVSSNVADVEGGGLQVFGTAYGVGTLTLRESSVTGNTAGNRGGGLRISLARAELVDVDLGTGAADNAPDDVSIGSLAASGLGAGTDLTCELTSCAP